MTIKELEKKLKVNRVPHHCYSLYGGLPNEAYCIERTDGKWHFYYSERGIKSTIGFYDREEDVVEALLNKIKKYYPVL